MSLRDVPLESLQVSVLLGVLLGKACNWSPSAVHTQCLVLLPRAWPGRLATCSTCGPLHR
jgi:hypothetical protein